ncbi:hypothetical protein GIB67_007023 [Kingdonia uniflora]|uniref:SWIM-type domain-containing protein n=1 Tax=Kingdonia uniflora TaxID=39325 RepID=A0A7J7NZJ6_9MAGN|nr:hypothetical protein GIB67_007023 [Kingdonia uniflora]
MSPTGWVDSDYKGGKSSKYRILCGEGIIFLEYVSDIAVKVNDHHGVGSYILEGNVIKVMCLYNGLPFIVRCTDDLRDMWAKGDESYPMRTQFYIKPTDVVIGMNGVQLYIIVHFGGDIVCPWIGSIVTYIGGSAKLTSLKAYSSYKDFVILLKETSEIRREDWLSTTKATGSGRGLSTPKAGGSLWHNSFPDPEPEYKGYLEINYRGLDPRRFGPLVDDENDSFKTIRTNVPPSNEPSIPQSNVHLSNKPVLTNAPQSNEPFQTIPINVPLSNEPSIPQSSIHLSNEPVLTNVSPSNEPMLTNVPISIEPEPIIGQTETSAEFRFEPQPEQVKNLLDFWFKSAAYTEDPYDFSKEFNIGDLYRDRIKLKNHIRAYAVVNKFNLEHILSNEYKIVMRGSFQHAYQLLTSCFTEVRLVDPDFVFDIQTTCCKDKRFTRYGVAYTNYVESWNNVILKMTCYGRTDSEDIEDGTCFCRLWQTMGLPCEHGVHALGLANVDPTTRVSEYYTNNTYKAIYEPIWIPISGIEQWKILKTDPRVRAPIPTVRADRPRMQRKRREKIRGHATKL